MTDKTQPDSGRATGGIVEMLHARIAELEARVQELGAMARENRSRRIVELEAQLEAMGAGGVSGPLMGRASLAASAGSEPVAQLASERDELFQAAIDFIRTLTGMEPPPIEVAPPDVFAPFHAFVNTVQAITNKRYRPPLGGVARPCHVFNVRKIGPRTEWTPTTMALALPDGEHALYTHPSPPKGMAGWKHDCAALLMNDVELWVQSCPHCGKPRDTAQPTAQAEGWRPIETAPKDCQAILVTEGRFCHCVEWNEEFDWWAVDDNKLGPFRLRGSSPTHWMPLPPPPTAAEGVEHG